MAADKLRNRWAWLYQGKAKKLKFRNPYSSIPKSHGPIVLGYFYVNENEPFIDLRSFERAIEAVLFFDKNIPRSVIKFKDIAVVNQCFEFSLNQRLNFDDFFESNRVTLINPDAIYDKMESMGKVTNIPEKQLDIMEYMENIAKEKLPEIERFPINYYEDGIGSLKSSLNMRGIVALEHWKGNKDFTLFDLIKKII